MLTASFRVQPVAAGCITFWWRGCATDEMPLFVLILPILERLQTESTPPGVNSIENTGAQSQDPKVV